MTKEEKLKEAKMLYQTANADQKYVLESFFPELKESEDERIRKTLIEYFNAYPKDYYGELKKRHILAWLEKQSEQKPTAEEMKELLQTEYEKGRADAIEEMQNHTWSEKDEVALGDALWCCKRAASIAKDENDMGNVWYAENWLKSLKERYTWKPSDEQMKALDIATMEVWTIQNKELLSALYNDLKKLMEE